MYKADHIAPRVYTQHNEVHDNSAGGDINVGPDTIVTKKTVERLETRVAELEQDKKNMQTLIDALTVKPRKWKTPTRTDWLSRLSFFLYIERESRVLV